MNPLLTVWLHPKQTARYVIEHKTVLYALLIVSLGFVASGSSAFQNTDLYPDIPYVWIILSMFILAPIAGLIIYAVMTGITFLVGKLLKGTGSFTDVLQACSIAYLPTIILLPLNLIWLFASPESYFLESENDLFSILITLITAVIGIWTVVINVAAVSEAHQFSILRAIVTLVAPTLLFILFIFAIIAVVLVAIIGIFV